MTRLLLALSLALTACEGSPFNPFGHTPVDECHPEKWLDKGDPKRNTAPSDSILKSYQAACKAAREARN